MENFVYVARDLAGIEKRGLKQGVSSHEIYAWLHAHGLIAIDERPVSYSVTQKKRTFGRRRVKYSDLAAFCWQMSTMLEGGILITEAIETVAEDIENTSFKETLIDICEQIKRGGSFSSSVAAFPIIFNKLFCAMIVAGESSGSLAATMQMANSGGMIGAVNV